MTVHQLLNGVIYMGAVAGSVTALGVFLHFVAVRPMRAFLRKEIVQSLTDINTSIKKSTTAVTSLEEKLEEHISNGGHHSA